MFLFIISNNKNQKPLNILNHWRLQHSLLVPRLSGTTHSDWHKFSLKFSCLRQAEEVLSQHNAKM